MSSRSFFVVSSSLENVDLGRVNLGGCIVIIVVVDHSISATISSAAKILPLVGRWCRDYHRLSQPFQHSSHQDQSSSGQYLRSCANACQAQKKNGSDTARQLLHSCMTSCGKTYKYGQGKSGLLRHCWVNVIVNEHSLCQMMLSDWSMSLKVPIDDMEK